VDSDQCYCKTRTKHVSGVCDKTQFLNANAIGASANLYTLTLQSPVVNL
jgi:hypothetical protein